MTSRTTSGTATSPDRPDDYVFRLQLLRQSMEEAAQAAGGRLYDFEWLRERLVSVAPDVRMEAARGMRHYGAQAVGPLCLALRDPDLRVRAAVAASLGDLEDVRAVQPLVNALRNCFAGRSARSDFWFGVFKMPLIVVAMALNLIHYLAFRQRRRNPIDELLDEYAESRRRRNDLLQAITTALGRIGERHPLPELRSVLPDLHLVARDVIQQRKSTRAASRKAAARIEALTTRLQDLPLPAVDSRRDGFELPYPSPAAALVQPIVAGE